MYIGRPNLFGWYCCALLKMAAWCDFVDSSVRWTHPRARKHKRTRVCTTMQKASVSGTNNIHFATTTTLRNRARYLYAFNPHWVCQCTYSGRLCVLHLFVVTAHWFHNLVKETCWRHYCGHCRDMHKASQRFVLQNCQWRARWSVIRCCLWSTFFAIWIRNWQQQRCILWWLWWHSNAHAQHKWRTRWHRLCVSNKSWHNYCFAIYFLNGSQVDHFVVESTRRHWMRPIMHSNPYLGLQCSCWRVLILSKWRTIAHQ